MKLIRLLSLVLLSVFLILFSKPALGQRTQTGKVHKVSRGETLYKIARKYKMELDELRMLNPNVKGNLIFPGQELVISLSEGKEDFQLASNTGLPRRSSSPEWEDGHIDQLRTKSERKVVVFNKPIEKPLSEELIEGSFQDRRIVHTVQPRQDIYDIARMYGVEKEKIIARNPGKEIKPGVQLIIPLNKGTDAILLSDEIKIRKLQPRHQRLVGNPSYLSDRGTYEVLRRDGLQDPYYVFHPSFKVGQKIFIRIPNNTGYIEAKVIGSLPEDSDTMIGISPRVYEVIKMAGDLKVLTIYFSPG